MLNSGTRSEYYILFAVGFIAAIWFFVVYPSQDPRSVAEVFFNKSEIERRAAGKLSEFGFSASGYTVTDVTYEANESLLDSLQRHWGRQKAIQLLKNKSAPNIKPYYWEVIFKKNSSGRETAQESDQGNPLSMLDASELEVRMDTDGHFMELINPGDHLPANQVKREALSAVFKPAADSVNRPVLGAVSDSLLGRLLYFDLQRPTGNYDEFTKKSAQQVQRNFSRGIPYRYSASDAKALSDYYISRTGWDLSRLEPDTVFIKRIETINAANIRYNFNEPILGQQLQLDVVVAPTGALLQMNASYNPGIGSRVDTEFIWGAIYTVIIFGLGLVGLFIFFFRMRARAIDTRTALVAAILMGVIVPLYIFLGRVDEINPFSSATSFNDILALFLMMGVVGALSSVGFFVLVSLSDSITRQHWPEKLASYDYLRQGMLFNKPIGVVLLRSVALSFVLLGFWTLLQQGFPGVFLEVDNVFLSERAAWPPIYLVLRNVWFTYSIMLAVFLGIGSQVYGWRNNLLFTSIITAVACGILVPVFLYFGPPYYVILMGFLFGIVLAGIYIKWDFLTLLVTHFLFSGILGTVTGWMIPNSPDAYIFYFFIGFLVLLIAGACAAIFTGKEERLLPDYVPSYVEELAQEQRIKQELQIAREVQRSFLPARMPQIPHIDIAAVCKPAYETGGDYYDVIELDGNRLAVAIGDVSGKGIQAAFYMTFVKGLLHSLCRETDSPAEVLKKTNRLFYENATKGTFISLVYGIIDLEKNEFTFARAGHNPVLHVNVAEKKVEELQPGGLGIGLTKDQVFDNKIEEIKLSITEDDMFLLYTDGIVEALNEKHQFYGTKNLIRLVKKHRRKSAKDIVLAVSKGVETYIGRAKQHDDMTLMAICCRDSRS